MRVFSRHKRANSLVYKRIAVVVLVVLLAWVFPLATHMVAKIVLTPVTAVSAWVRESNHIVPRMIRDRQALITEIQALEQALAAGQGSHLTTRRLVSENNELRGLLSASSTPRIAAGIIARPNQLPYDVMQIDRGTHDGVVVGAPVYRNESALLGVVERVLPELSFVRLITSPGFAITAYVYGSGVVAPMEGIGGGIARVRVPQGVRVEVGAMVVLPGINTAVIGEVVSVGAEPTQPDQFAYVASPVALNSLRVVSVGVEPLPVLTPSEVVVAATEMQTAWLISQEVVPLKVATTSGASSTQEIQAEVVTE